MPRPLFACSDVFCSSTSVCFLLPPSLGAQKGIFHFFLKPFYLCFLLRLFSLCFLDGSFCRSYSPFFFEQFLLCSLCPPPTVFHIVTLVTRAPCPEHSGSLIPLSFSSPSPGGKLTLEHKSTCALSMLEVLFVPPF